MKTFILLLCVSALSLSTIRSDDACCENKAATIQAKLQDIDLNCLVMKYEAMQNAKTQAELQVVMLEAQGGDDDTERQALHRRIEVLNMHAKQVRKEIEEMSKAVAVAAK